MPDNSDSIFLMDACILINLMAAEILSEIVENSGLKFAISSFIVEKEVHFVFQEKDAGLYKIKIDISDFTDSGKIIKMYLEDNEAQMVVDLSQDVDDGEAYTIALAVCRKLNMVSDDKKAGRLFRKLQKDGVLLSTEALLYRWAKKNFVSLERLKNVLLKIEKCARYLPPKDSEFYLWWREVKESLS
ncbi:MULTISPECIES: hypothetical protein [Leptospira]|uniref:PIN domain-containing protein n=1 Tax=Leptospira santarosai TaxID=28183 RepID=A0AB73NBZ6_9LEPT|nr:MULTISPECIES: hypothetical protein [Leptospira]EKO77487.1 hypothetical protein LEP1GSC068_3602 [Leptospira sp. Fiocruz LV3954]OLY64535.1 hypothetical protein BWD11_08285 [Leptospira santarosai serovar Grippotyphosa]ASV10540.1 hypothetical protein B2G51_00585 [Leptospira santarosai]AVV49364.1 Uncharacterized protein XB17_00760 [Leptospira santarosai]EMI69799.1 hypothetical protein LEP1GSC076_2413 [Leptospira sp. Fiocruz LV4135]